MEKRIRLCLFLEGNILHELGEDYVANNIIEVEKLSKSFNEVVALSNISFVVKEGEIFGFLGPSGSGKTTAISIITGQMCADSGFILTLNKNISDMSSIEQSNIGIVAENLGFYENLSVYDNLKLYAKLFKKDIGSMEKLLKEVGIFENKDIKASQLSTGMRQRMLLVRSLLNNPKLLFLDEPTSGLDPTTSEVIHKLLINLKNQGTTIFLTTHDMNEATLLCDNICLINKGEIIEYGAIPDIIQKYNSNKTVKVSIHGVVKEIPIDKIYELENIEKLDYIHSCEPSLNDIFIRLTGGKLNA